MIRGRLPLEELSNYLLKSRFGVDAVFRIDSHLVHLKWLRILSGNSWLVGHIERSKILLRSLRRSVKLILDSLAFVSYCEVPIDYGIGKVRP